MRSAAFRKALGQIERFARHPSAPVLLEGEPGTGKTTLARYLHSISPRADKPFCHVPLSAIDDSLASSELFGHVAGAFTDAKSARPGQFVSANGGTLFLDELGKASLSVQQKLLHAVESHEIRPVGSDRVVKVDTRLVVATNVSLSRLVEAGTFLTDLNARFEVNRILLPPLRERSGDVRLLVLAAIEQHAGECGYECPPAVGDDLMQALELAPWPNNVRQRDATVQRLLIEAEGASTLSLVHCRDSLAYLRANVAQPSITREVAAAAVAREGGVTAAARMLGVHRTTLHRHLRAGESDQQ